MKRIVTCEYCKHKFEKSAGRIGSECNICPDYNPVMSCGYIKCPRCGKDFPDPDVPEFMRKEGYTSRR